MICMKLKIIGSLTENLKTKLDKISYEFTENSSDADFVVISSGIGTYFLNTVVGAMIEDAYKLEFENGKPLVLKESDFLNKDFSRPIQISL
jgi:hypothetical protein